MNFLVNSSKLVDMKMLVDSLSVYLEIVFFGWFCTILMKLYSKNKFLLMQANVPKIMQIVVTFGHQNFTRDFWPMIQLYGVFLHNWNALLKLFHILPHPKPQKIKLI